MEKYVRFDKSMTAVVKGFAIIFMMLLHCYTRGYDVPLDYSHSLFPLETPMFRICVGMFLFLVGYGYAFSKEKDLSYSVSHIIKLFIPYFTIFLVFMLPIIYDELAHEDLTIIIYNLLGFESSYYYYNWFVYFFIFAMIVMPFVARFINRKPLLNTAIAIVVSLLLSIGVHEIPRLMSWFGVQIADIVDNKPLLALFFCLNMLPVTLLGYLFAHEGYYERINVGNRPKWVILLLCLAAMVLALVLRRFWSPIHIPFQFDFFYAPLMIGGIVVMFNTFEWRPVKAVLMKLGEVSVYMWFLQSIFFTKAVRWLYQPAITIFSDINLVVLWAIVFTFFASWLIKTVVDWVVNVLSGKGKRA